MDLVTLKWIRFLDSTFSWILKNELDLCPINKLTNQTVSFSLFLKIQSLSQAQNKEDFIVKISLHDKYFKY